MSQAIPTVTCPKCSKPMTSAPLPPGKVPAASSYATCLRQCRPCSVGASNARSGDPTWICEDPLDNLPPQVQLGARGALAQALNLRNRSNKLAKFGFSTSEDAVTWTVFSYLHAHQRDALPALYRSVLGLQVSEAPTMLLWGAPVPATLTGQKLQQAVEQVSDALGEHPDSRTEPDVVLDFGEAGLVIVEVKYKSGNDVSDRADKFARYVNEPGAFPDSASATTSQLYELVRNWRFAADLANGRPFALVNLAPAKTLAKTPGMPEFLRGIAPSSGRTFVPLSWADVLATARQTCSVGHTPHRTQGLPQWFEAYLKARELG